MAIVTGLVVGPVGLAGVDRAAGVAPHIAVTQPSGPAFADNAGDPDLVQDGTTWYAFTTGTVLGNHIQALVDTSGDPQTGWRSYTGQDFGSTALPDVPAWQQINTQTSPGVLKIGGHWVMWYDASLAGHPGFTGFQCLAVATAPSLSPSSPVFTDTTTSSPWCPPGGVLDPSPFLDPTTQQPYLVWKTNDGSTAAPSQVWGVRLDSSGTTFAGTPSLLLTVTAAEQTLDNPELVAVRGAIHLLFSGGDYQNSSYNEQLADCAGPLGPCSNPPGPFLTTFGSAYGPGGGSITEDSSGRQWLAFAAWNNPCSLCDLDLVTNRRMLYVAPTDLAPSAPIPLMTGMAATPTGNGYWLVDARGGIHPRGDAQNFGSMAGTSLNAPIIHLVATPDGNGYWMVAGDGGIFSFGDARFYGSMGGTRLNGPIVGLAPTADGGGYWLVGSDGGVFSFGDARFYGSMGGTRLNRPIVGIAGSGAGGYWLVASDGGIFAFGAAPFFGSTGALTLAAPITGMAVSSGGSGYWLVASDGGIFAFGDAPFFGSTGALTLAAPITGMAADPQGRGYWLVAADGGVFAFGAPFLGAG